MEINYNEKFGERHLVQPKKLYVAAKTLFSARMTSSCCVPYARSLVVHVSARPWLSAHKTLVYSIRVLQGTVATCLMRGWIFNDGFMTNFLQSVPEQKFSESAENN